MIPESRVNINSKDKEADIFLKSKIGEESAVKLKSVEQSIEGVETHPPEGMSVEIKTAPKKVAKSAPKPTEAQRMRASGLSPIPSPPSTIEKDEEPVEFVLKADVQTGPLIDDFNIAYYEKSGGSNFVLVEELHESFASDHFEKLSEFVKLINKLKLEKYTRTQAKANLNSEYNKLIDSLF